MNPWYYFLHLFLRNRLAVRQNALLWVLAISTEHNRPLGPMLEALAQDESSYHWSQRLRELAQYLNSGLSLPDALDRLPGLLSANIVLAIRVAAETGTLPEMLKQTARDFSDQQDEGYATWLGTLVYLAALIFFLLSIAGFVMYYIIPKFKRIFEDFGTELPDLTRWVIEVSDLFAQWFRLVGPALLLGWFWIAWRTRYGINGGLLRQLLFSHTRGQSPGF
ncbi:MAG: type II secretion system F family protein, partial [Planctomycetaceae bacterium]|nr:type II secretion system F family protein [Planctomycetaceae bacterium]